MGEGDMGRELEKASESEVSRDLKGKEKPGKVPS